MPFRSARKELLPSMSFTTCDYAWGQLASTKLVLECYRRRKKMQVADLSPLYPSKVLAQALLCPVSSPVLQKMALIGYITNCTGLLLGMSSKGRNPFPTNQMHSLLMWLARPYRQSASLWYNNQDRWWRQVIVNERTALNNLPFLYWQKTRSWLYFCSCRSLRLYCWTKMWVFFYPWSYCFMTDLLS